MKYSGYLILLLLLSVQCSRRPQPTTISEGGTTPGNRSTPSPTSGPWTLWQGENGEVVAARAWPPAIRYVTKDATKDLVEEVPPLTWNPQFTNFLYFCRAGRFEFLLPSNSTMLYRQTAEGVGSAEQWQKMTLEGRAYNTEGIPRIRSYENAAFVSYDPYKGGSRLYIIRSPIPDGGQGGGQDVPPAVSAVETNGPCAFGEGGVYFFDARGNLMRTDARGGGARVFAASNEIRDLFPVPGRAGHSGAFEDQPHPIGEIEGKVLIRSTSGGRSRWVLIGEKGERSFVPEDISAHCYPGAYCADSRSLWAVIRGAGALGDAQKATDKASLVRWSPNGMVTRPLPLPPLRNMYVIPAGDGRVAVCGSDSEPDRFSAVGVQVVGGGLEYGKPYLGDEKYLFRNAAAVSGSDLILSSLSGRIDRVPIWNSGR